MNNLELDNVFVYTVSLPDGIREAVTPCISGYTIYINQKLSYEQRLKAYSHALRHIQNNDFDGYDVQAIEARAH